ncbi:MAG: hypothetical protein WD042_13670 [Phycisphaeraceae bacterium]
MQITPRHNLTVALIRRANFGSLRYRLAAVPLCRQPSVADRLRFVGMLDRGQRVGNRPPSTGFTALPPCRSKAWPYDTPMPAGLPEISPPQTPVTLPRQHPVAPVDRSSLTAVMYQRGPSGVIGLSSLSNLPGAGACGGTMLDVFA